MAHAKAEVEEVVTRTTTAIVLRLTPDEADFLADILGNIAGPPTSRRRHQSEISNWLKVAGVRRTYNDYNDLSGIISVR